MKWWGWLAVGGAGLVVALAAGKAFAAPVRTRHDDDGDDDGDDGEQGDAEGEPEFGEDRVRVADYGSLKSGDKRLKRVGAPWEFGGGRLVHEAIHADVIGLLTAAKAAGYDLQVSSGWRAKPWKSFADYEKWCIKPKKDGGGGYKDTKECRKYKAWDSPHETGLAIDLRGEGLVTNRHLRKEMEASAVYLWLKENAAKFGFTPYLAEPWHWEHRIAKEQF